MSNPMRPMRCRWSPVLVQKGLGREPRFGRKGVAAISGVKMKHTYYFCILCDVPLRADEAVFCEECLTRERLYLHVPRVDAAQEIIPDGAVVEEWFRRAVSMWWG